MKTILSEVLDDQCTSCAVKIDLSYLVHLLTLTKVAAVVHAAAKDLRPFKIIATCKET
jgi:ribonuclease D